MARPPHLYNYMSVACVCNSMLYDDDDDETRANAKYIPTRIYAGERPLCLC